MLLFGRLSYLFTSPSSTLKTSSALTPLQLNNIGFILTRMMFLIFLSILIGSQGSQALEFTIEPTDAVVPEGHSVLLQCSGKIQKDLAIKENINKLIPNIRWRGPDGQDIGIVGDTFRTQLKNGSLYISSVEENRGLTGAYQCLLSFDGIGTIVSHSAIVSIAKLPDLSQDYLEVHILPGQTAYFRCIIGQLQSGVKHHIQWLKDDVPFNIDTLKMVMLPNGALEIDEISNSDRGQYQCNVTSGSISRLSGKTTLNVKSGSGVENEAAPSFVVGPSPKTVKEGDVVTLDCVANGVPKPQIKWLKNGVEIDMGHLDSRFAMIGSGSLQISSAEDIDSGNYQCRASNSVESLDAQATVQVQVPPKFVQNPTDKQAYEKEELELECSIRGMPKPYIQWLKNGDVIKPNDYMQIVGGHNLRILGLLQSDAGMFQCVGINPAGSVQASARLKIIQPGKSKKQSQTTKSLNSTPKKKTGEPKPPAISQTTDSRILSKSALDSLLSKDKKRKNFEYHQEHAPKPDYNDENENVEEDYYDDDDDDDDVDVDTENTYKNDNDDDDDEEYTYPFKPGDDPDKILDSWKHKNSDKNTIQTKPKEDDNVQESVYVPYPKLTRKLNKNNLDGKQAASIALPGSPRDLEAQIVKPRFVALSWMEPLKNPDEVTSYSVYYKMQSSERERKITTKSRDDQQVNIQSLLPGKTYQFRVVGNSNQGPGESSEILEVNTQPEENIAGSPRNVEGYAINAKEITLKWEAPFVTNGLISKYRIYYAEDESGAEMYTDSTLLETILTELRPFTEYTITVVPFNQNGMGDTSNEIKIKTFSSTPSEPPSNVTMEVTSSTAITVHWEPPPEEDRNGQITGYKIRYRKLKEGTQVKTTPANFRHLELENLERNSEYQVKISAMTVNGSGPFTEWHRVVTLENDLDETQVPGKPRWIAVRPGGQKITLHWAPPAQQEIKIRSYILGWGKGIPDENTEELRENERYYELKDLDANTEYVIALRARNIKGDGPPIYDNVKTREDEPLDVPAPLEVPVGLRAVTMSSFSIVVYWIDTMLSKNQQVTDNRHYTVQYRPIGTSRFRYHNTTDLNCMLTDLKPNTQYEFAVKVVKGRRESAWSMSVWNSTLPHIPLSPPRDLVVRTDEYNPQNVLLQWQPPKHVIGEITGYMVYYTTDTTKRDRDWQTELVIGDTNAIPIKGLKPYTTYYFKIQTKTGKGSSPYSALVSHSTGSAVLLHDNNVIVKGFDNQMIVYMIIGVIALTLFIAMALIILLCKKKPQSSPEHTKKSYQKNNSGVPKPPDLWIHHEQMELKNIEKPLNNHTPGCSDGNSSTSAMTLPRSVIHEYDTESNGVPHNMTNSLDKRSYVPGYMTTSMNSTMERPQYPRTQYTMPNRSLMTVDTTLSQQSLSQPQNNSIAQTPEHPYCYETLSNSYISTNLTSYMPPGISIEPNNTNSGKRGQSHPLKSFSVPGPPPLLGSTPNSNKHVIRPQNASPYKMPIYTAQSTPTNRLQNGHMVAHSNDEIQRLKPSTSTEELNQEMANLEGLMKDLSAITANEFEC